MRKIFCIKFELEGEAYRFSTDKVTVTETIDGQDIEIDYVPYLTKIDPSESVIDLEDDSSVPNVKVSIWDGFRELANAFEAVEYESAEVSIFYLDKDGTQHGVLDGYMSDVSSDGPILGMTVRVDEDGMYDDLFTVFSYDTFQKIQVLTPSDVGLLGYWELNEDTPWTTAAVSLVKSRLNSDVTRGSSSITLVTKNNRYPAWTYDSVNDEFTKTDEPIFTGAPNYALITDVSSHGTVKVGEIRHEIIEYTTVEEGTSGDNVRLTGIPTTGAYSIKFNHSKYAVVTPLGAKDIVYLKANGLAPLSVDDPDLGVGFIFAGQEGVKGSRSYSTSEVEEGSSVEPGEYREDKIRLFHRYELVDILQPDSNPDGIYYLKMEIHNRHLDSAHTAAVSKGPGLFPGSYELPFFIQNEGEPIKFVSFNWVVPYMDFLVRGVGGSMRADLVQRMEQGGAESFFVNRLRGSRVDMIENLSSLTMEVANSNFNGGSVNYTEVNNNILNNATGKFAVATTSKMFSKKRTDNNYEIFERVEFNTPIRSALFVPEPESVEDSTTAYLGSLKTTSSGVPSVAPNYMTYKRSYSSKSELLSTEGSDLGMSAAKSYFLSNFYRVFHNPVPENSADLGTLLPVSYGHLEKVPMVHAVSKKVLAGDELTAGDDLYVYASHQCSVSSPFDISVYLLNEDGGIDSVDRINSTAMQNAIIQSPFPNYLDGHHRVTAERVRQEGTNEIVEVKKIEYAGKLYNPYHKLEEIVSNDGKKFYAVKLRGDEWEPAAGVLDKRYAIRNGVGSSVLYASFSGYPDETGKYTGIPGSVIEHPLDIMRHFNDIYGRYPFNQNVFDTDNIERIKAKTRRYKAGVYIREGIPTPSQIIGGLCRQFGIYRYFKSGKIYFTTIDFDFINYQKPVSEDFNLLTGVKEQSAGYKNIYNEVVYKYDKNWVSGDYNKTIYLNKNNNYYCSRADRAKGGKKPFVIEAGYVSSHAVANEVANRIAKVVCPRKVTYSLKLKYVDGISFVPGDYVPMTYSDFGFKNEPVLVTSVKEGQDIIELEVVRFTNLL